MIQNKLALTLTLIATCIYAQEPVDISRFVYDTVIAADCVQGKAPEDTCAQFIANIELMMRVGAEQQEKVQEVLNEAPASGDPRIAEIVRVNKLRNIIINAAVAAQSQFDNRKVNEYIHTHIQYAGVTSSIGAVTSAREDKKNIESLYFNVLLQHITVDTAMYYKVIQNLRIRTGFFRGFEPLEASQKAFFAVVKDTASC